MAKMDLSEIPMAELESIKAQIEAELTFRDLEYSEAI
jgi:hypothetical protein